MTAEAVASYAPQMRPPLWLVTSSGEVLPPPDREDGVKQPLTRQRRKPSTRDKDNTEYIGFLRRAIRAAGRRVKAEDPSTLAELIALREELDDVINDAARSLHDEHHFSWGDIAYELQVTRQAAFQRWGRGYPRYTPEEGHDRAEHGLRDG